MRLFWDFLQVALVLAFMIWLLAHFEHPAECVDMRITTWGSECP